MTIVIAILAETIVASFASFFLKKAAAVDNKAKILLSPFFYLGGIMYVGSACVNIYLLKVLPYAVVLPIGSLTYVWTMFISHWLLKEIITKRKILGIAIIFIGVFLVAYGKSFA